MNVLNDIPFAHSPGAISRHTENPDWWRGAVIYQIYPRSFQDSNGDGIGDLRGITQRLPYIASLGVDAIWLSPFFQSPMLDFGYDVSDYKQVDPMFGTMADFDAMITEAHRLDLKIIIDQVISHSSDRHPWFMESRQDRTNPRADWYVWADPKPDGSPPNNWLSIFGGSAWHWDTSRCQYYLHNFLASQPDLNFHNPEVQDALLDTVRFWLDRGVDGFRLDTINFYFHSAGLEDNPPLEHDKRNSKIAPAVNPYNYQDHIYDRNRPENVEFLRRFRALLDEYPGSTAVGEVGDGQRSLDIIADYTGGGDKIHMCYSFDFLSHDPLTPARVREVVGAMEEKAPDGWACWSFSNHDVVRHASRWADQVHDRMAYLKMTTNLILSLRGSVCLYQGEELGLSEAVLAFEDLQDPYGIQFWPTFKGRDGCRTPIVWSEHEVHAGFSSGKPWLPVPPEHLHLAVSSQSKGDTMLTHYRNALAFRKRHPEFTRGSIRFLDGGDGGLVFERTLGNNAILVAINMTEQPAELALDLSDYTELEDSVASGRLSEGKLTLPPFASWFGSLV